MILGFLSFYIKGNGPFIMILNDEFLSLKALAVLWNNGRNNLSESRTKGQCSTAISKQVDSKKGKTLFSWKTK